MGPRPPVHRPDALRVRPQHCLPHHRRIHKMDANRRRHGNHPLPLRHRPRPPPHDPHASLLPLPPRLGRRPPLPPPRHRVPDLLLHAHRLVRHRSHPLLLLRPLPLRLHPAPPHLAALQHLLHSVSYRHPQRVLPRLPRRRRAGGRREGVSACFGAVCAVCHFDHLRSGRLRPLHAHDGATEKGHAKLEGKGREGDAIDAVEDIYISQDIKEQDSTAQMRSTTTFGKKYTTLVGVLAIGYKRQA